MIEIQFCILILYFNFASGIIKMSRLFELSPILEDANVDYEYLDVDYENDSEILDSVIIKNDGDKIDFINNILKKNTDIKRGDILHYGNSSYRNEGKLIWTGTELIKLDEELDEYDHLPYSFTLNDFPDYDYFDNVISHNNIRWIQIDNYNMITEICEIMYNNGKFGKYFVVTIINNDEEYHYKILIPHQYLDVDSSQELYDKLIEDKNLDMNSHNNCLALEIDGCLTGFTDIENMYVIYSHGKIYNDEDNSENKYTEECFEIEDI